MPLGVSPSTTRTLVLLAVLVSGGCLGTASDPTSLNESVEQPNDGAPSSASDDDGTANASSPDGDGSHDGDGTDDGTEGATQNVTNDTEPAESITDDSDGPPPGAPESLDERAAARMVRNAVDRHRQGRGFRELQLSRALAVGASATANAELARRGPTPPFTVNGSALNLSTEELLQRFQEKGASSCTGRSKDRAGQLSAARDVTALHTGPGFPEPIPELLADELVDGWRSTGSTEPVLTGGYRYAGADVRYDPETAVAYVTVALC